MGACTDTQLIQRTLAGHVGDFDSLVSKYNDDIERYVTTKVKNPLDAQDIQQEIWMNAYQNLASLRDPTRFLNWLIVIAGNACKVHLKGQNNAPQEFTGEVSVLPFQPDEEHLHRARQRRLLRAVDSLSQTLKRTVSLHYLTGYSCPEVSTKLNVPVGTVKRRLSDARKKLKSLFNDWSQPGQDTIGAGSLIWLLTFTYNFTSISDHLAVRIS